MPSRPLPVSLKWLFAAVALGVGLAAVSGLALAVGPKVSAGPQRYCEKPSPNASLAVSPGVSCAVAEKIKQRLVSKACFTRTRCVASGFRCVAYWDGRFDRGFTYTHYALCNDGWRWVVWNGG